MDTLEDSLKIITLDTGSLGNSELGGESLLVLLSELVHVLSDVTTEDVLASDLEVGLSTLLSGGTGETASGVGNVDTTIASTLDGSEDTRTGGGAVKTNIKDSLEGATGVSINTRLIDGLSISLTNVVVTVHGILGAEEGKLEVSVDLASKEETGSIGSSPRVEAELEAIAGKLVAVSSADNAVTVDVGSNDSNNNITVGETNNETVLGSSVLVLVLPDETLTSVVVGLSLATTAELNLEALEVSLALNNLDETLL